MQNVHEFIFTIRYSMHWFLTILASSLHWKHVLVQYVVVSRKGSRVFDMCAAVLACIYPTVILMLQILNTSLVCERHYLYFLCLRTRPVMDLVCSPSASQYTPIGLTQFLLPCFKPNLPPHATTTHPQTHTDPGQNAVLPTQLFL